MTRSLLVSVRAVADLHEIWHYSLENWGEDQADRYLDELAEGMRACAEQPSHGRRRDELRDGYWSLRIRRHVVFYTFDDESMLVQRVLHGAMDPALHVEDGAADADA